MKTPTNKKPKKLENGLGQVASMGNSDSSNGVEFDSTASWFLLNVNSYCEGQENIDSVAVNTEHEKEKEVSSMGSNMSSFMAIVNDYSGIGRPRLVDYDCSSSVELALSSTNEQPPRSPRINEQCDDKLCDAIVMVPTKSQGFSSFLLGEIGSFADYPGPSSVAHTVIATATQPTCPSMVSQMFTL